MIYLEHIQNQQQNVTTVKETLCSIYLIAEQTWHEWSESVPRETFCMVFIQIDKGVRV